VGGGPDFRLRLAFANLSALRGLLVGCLRPFVSTDVATVSTSPAFSACSRTLATCGWLVSVSFATRRFDFVGSALSNWTITRSLARMVRGGRWTLARTP